jgi:hypothetical protein
MQADWLLLTDYASKYRISVSTLRRRIKGGQIKFRFDGGKYFIFDAPRGSALPVAGLQDALPLFDPEAESDALRPSAKEAEGQLNELRNLRAGANRDAHQIEDEPIISTATRLLNELKRAYMSVLQEKEEQIIQLKEEVTDLKTLVRVLEEDNDRMRRLFISPRV